MCGIAGFADTGWQGRTDGQAQARLESEFALVHRMCDVIRHRGPDDEGMHVEPGVALGMRRLSIIDLAGGPPADPQRGPHRLDRLQRRDLQLPRAARASSSSAATASTPPATPRSIVHAYEAVGRGRVRAAARHVRPRDLGRPDADAAARARSRRASSRCTTPSATAGSYFGERDQVAARGAGVVEPRARSAARSITTSRSSTRRATRRSSKASRKLPPGHYLTLAATGASTIGATGRCRRTETFRGSEAEAVEAAARRARRTRSARTWSATCRSARSSPAASTRRRRRPDGATPRRAPVKTFSIGFDEPDVRRARARATRRRPFRHRSPRVRRQARRAVAFSTARSSHFDEPFADSSAIPTWYVSEMARRHVTVVLSGDGGDELFGGYDRYLPHPRVAAFDRVPLPGAARGRGAGLAAAAARRARQELPAPRRPQTIEGRYSTRSRFSGADEKRGAAIGATCERALAGRMPKRALARHFERFAGAAAGRAR